MNSTGRGVPLFVVGVLSGLLFFTFFLAACGGGGGGSGGTGSTAQDFNIDSAGGDLDYVSPDDPDIIASLDIPAGAVSDGTVITIDLSSSIWDSRVIPGLGFVFSPDGLSFGESVDFTITYDETTLPGGMAENELRVHRWNGADWDELPCVVDPVSNTIRTTLAGFSEYFLFPLAVPITNKLYFRADDGIHGMELWSFDGASATLAADIYPGAENGILGINFDFVLYDGKLYFTAFTENFGSQLWSFDGTTASMIADLCTGNCYPNPRHLAVYDGNLYFAARGNTGGAELWSFDGNTASMAADINTTTASAHSNPSYLASYNGKLYFLADDGVHGNELWSWDGSVANMAADINTTGPGAGSYGLDLATYNGKLYFGAGDGINGYALWSFDGSTAMMEADMSASTSTVLGTADGLPQKLKVYDGKLYFGVVEEINGEELWSFDGSTAQLTTNIAPGSAPAGVGGGRDGGFEIYNNKLFFRAHDGVHGWELWSYDSAQDTMTLEADIETGPGSGNPFYLKVYAGKLYFAAGSASETFSIEDTELWSFDGNTAIRAANINATTPTASSTPKYTVAY